MRNEYEADVEKDHNTRREVLIEGVIIYGAVVVLIIWNWW